MSRSSEVQLGFRADDILVLSIRRLRSLRFRSQTRPTADFQRLCHYPLPIPPCESSLTLIWKPAFSLPLWMMTTMKILPFSSPLRLVPIVYTTQQSGNKRPNPRSTAFGTIGIMPL
jgi:hypothetical protein